MVFLDGGKIRPQYRFSSLLNVGPRPFNPYAPGRHAALRDQLAEAPELRLLWSQLGPWLSGRPLIAHNAATERKILGEAFPLHRFTPWIDTLELARRAYPDTRSHKLEELIPALGLERRVHRLCPEREPHDALYDAVACAVLFEHLLALPGWSGLSLDDIRRASSRRNAPRR